MTACLRCEDDLALYVERDLPGDQVSAIESHLEGCAACRDFLAELGASQGAVKALAAEPLDEGALAAVRAGVASRRSHRRFRLPAAWRLAIAASVALAAATALWLAKPRRAPDTVAETAVEATATPAPGPTAEPPRTTASLRRQPAASKRPRAPSVRAQQRRTTPPPVPIDPTFGLSPEDADQLARAVVAISRVERVGEDPDLRLPAPEPTPMVQIATADPNVVLYWRLETNGENQ